MEPLIADEEREVVIVVANRSGEEEGGVRYAGTSWVGKVGGRGQEKVGIWGMLGRGEEGVLKVDTREEMQWVVRDGRGGGGGVGGETSWEDD